MVFQKECLSGDSSKIAIVVGGTGLIGKALVDKLANADHISKIITLTRGPAEHFSPKVHNQVIQFNHMEDYAPLFKGDLLFSCLGTTRKQAGSIVAQRMVDLEYQYTAAKLALNNGVCHYLLVSSSGANSHSNNAYLQMKGELEDRVQELSFDHISIFQPSLLLGKREDFRIGEKLGSWVLPVLCALPGLRRFRPIQGEKVAEKMIQVSQNPGPSLERFSLDKIF